MPLVGATAENAAMIMMSFDRLLKAMDRLSDNATFIFGASPTLADFGFYGQLQSLATDPTPWVSMRGAAPGVFPYLQLLEDSSGIETQELSLLDIGTATADLLRIAVDIYLPYLRANERALAENEPSFAFEVDGLRYAQEPFKYHAKCYRVLREKFSALDPGARSQVEAVLGSTDLLLSR
jgi:hypothetical protein